MSLKAEATTPQFGLEVRPIVFTARNGTGLARTEGGLHMLDVAGLSAVDADSQAFVNADFPAQTSPEDFLQTAGVGVFVLAENGWSPSMPVVVLCEDIPAGGEGKVMLRGFVENGTTNGSMTAGTACTSAINGRFVPATSGTRVCAIATADDTGSVGRFLLDGWNGFGTVP